MSGIRRIGTRPRSSAAVVHNGVVYLSGQTPDDRSQDVGGQVKQVLDKIDLLLTEAGGDKSRLLTAHVYLKEVIRDFAELNRVWEAWVPSGSAPARATIQAELASPQILVEIVVTAALADD